MPQSQIERDDRVERKMIDTIGTPDMLTTRERVFADRVLAGATHRDAAMRAYALEERGGKKTNKADQKALILMRRERVVAYLAREARGAAERVVALSRDAESESVRLNANQDILDRAGIAPPKKEEPPPNIVIPIYGGQSIINLPQAP